MLLTITTTRKPATDLGYLLHKHPGRLQPFSLPFGRAHVFYPRASEEVCTAALLLDVDPVGLIRRGVRFPRLDQYVNDRPYVASSFLSVAIARVFGTALAGRCADARARVPADHLRTPLHRARQPRATPGAWSRHEALARPARVRARHRGTHSSASYATSRCGAYTSACSAYLRSRASRWTRGCEVPMGRRGA